VTLLHLKCIYIGKQATWPADPATGDQRFRVYSRAVPATARPVWWAPPFNNQVSMSATNIGAALTLGCCVEPRIRKRVEDIVRLDGTRVIGLEVADLDHDNRLDQVDVVIYDLHPWNENALGMVERVAAQHPEIPLLLYPPTHMHGVGALLVRAGALGAELSAEFQGANHDDLQRFRNSLHTLFQSVPRTRLKASVAESLQQTPALMQGYVGAVIDMLFEGNGKADVSVSRVAHRLRSTTRTLERACQKASLPTPKELCSWIVLIRLADLARRGRIPMSAAAKRCGVNTNKLHRLRRRLLPKGSSDRARSCASIEDILREFKNTVDGK